MDDGDIDPEIAAAMGFSSFGGTKRRKFNHDAAVIDGDNFKPQPSGANTAPLGVRTTTSISQLGETSFSSPTYSDNPATQFPKDHDPGRPSQIYSSGFDLPKRPPKRQDQPEGQTQTLSKPSQPGNPEASPTTKTAFPTGVPKQFFDKLTWKELEAFRKGVKDENGDVAFFLPSFIEDPWAKLEREAEATGS